MKEALFASRFRKMKRLLGFRPDSCLQWILFARSLSPSAESLSCPMHPKGVIMCQSSSVSISIMLYLIERKAPGRQRESGKMLLIFIQSAVYTNMLVGISLDEVIWSHSHENALYKLLNCSRRLVLQSRGQDFPLCLLWRLFHECVCVYNEQGDIKKAISPTARKCHYWHCDKVLYSL